MLFEDEEKIVNDEVAEQENEELPEEAKELEAGIVAGLTDVDTVGLVQESFLDYAMSVIVARAIPDVRDGMKPVHRRILYTMMESGFTPDKGYVKCAKTVGAVIGNYHSLGKTEYKGVKYAELGDKNDIAHLPKQNNRFAASLMAELDKAGIKYQARVEDMTSISVHKSDMPRVTDIKNELVKTLNPEKQTNSAPKHKR